MGDHIPPFRARPETCGPFAIGAVAWPGLAKLSEEGGELGQVIGKLLAYPNGDHPDGAGDLVERLHDELADVQAAIQYVIEANNLNVAYIAQRRDGKIRRFFGWHQNERAVQALHNDAFTEGEQG